MAKKKVASESTVAKKTPRKKTTRKTTPRKTTAAKNVDSDSASLANPYTELNTYKHLFSLIAILIAITWVGLTAGEEDRVYSWTIILLLMTAFAVVLGKGITGHWRGILIDSRNRMSLSRLQVLAWTLVILSAIFTAALTNIAYGWQSPLAIEIPSQLWVVMGISTASVVGSSAILSNKANTEPALDSKSNTTNSGLLERRSDKEDARWSDLMMGEEVGNCKHVDIGKLQMFFFTFILVVGYGAAMASMFRESGVVTGLPEVQEGMNVLLGISHTGYLANKTIPHTALANSSPAGTSTKDVK